MSTYTVVYRTGGRENYRWQRSLAMSRSEASETAQSLERAGYLALIHKTSLLDAVGLPETYD